ncbi:hypothetical protein GCM10010264_61740 [Streptomyces globisporus]|nr:hypothetical protein GCM10010264_61740 [Streptomyces globisporus]
MGGLIIEAPHGGQADEDGKAGNADEGSVHKTRCFASIHLQSLRSPRGGDRLQLCLTAQRGAEA